ncbi:hypothetical protein DI09_87p80 [Mitosporidium daphniae]|uniref:Uncharacterized protein n=1 Tax=Mitosporidium daphniae TaxID=1485682 RepID=A0A098VME0_9MICR|nr:uncharacterized protein DI09_87p80 [Mitosporidium daphniae]KGG50135.1 hypothetical protein DI09_87p80 [Mitosporidium daphniae]|eukprot:XP_013236571.1 uncharacterized protein DI09_87p80 [Mitosporidium daphniae]
MLVDPKKGYIFYGTGILLLLLAGIIFYAVNLSGSLAISKHSSPTTDISQVAELIPIPEQKKHGIKIANMVNPMLKTLGKRREEPFFDNGINILGKIFVAFSLILSIVAGFGILAISLVYICGLTIFPFILHLWTEFLNICQAIEVPELPGKSKIAYFFSRIKSRFSRRNLDDTYPHPSAPSYYTEQQPAFNPYFKEEEEPK